MPEKVLPGPVQGHSCFKEAVCVHTKKVYDSCKDKDCLEDLRVYLTRSSQQVVDRAVNVKCRRAELLWVFIDVEPVPFNRGFYTIDVKYFYRITADAFCGVGRPTEICGLATFDKRVILFGSEGNAKIFSSQMAINAADEQSIRKSNVPTAVVEVVDPICLGMKLVDCCDCSNDCCELPENICQCFEDDLVVDGGDKRLFVTLGQFSIIKLERDSQLVMPVLDICLPDKECVGSSEENPCELFRRINFPVDEFFPPNVGEFDNILTRDNMPGCCR